MNVDNGALEFDTYFNNERLNRTALEAERRIKGLSNTAVSEGKKMEDSFSGVGKAFAMAGGAAAIGLLGNSILDTTAKFEKFGIVLRNTLGAEAGNNALDMIANFAATTPFQLDEVTDSFIRMANQGFVPTRQELVKLGDLASSTGKGFNQLTEAILDAQTGEFERLKEFGIKASQNGDKVTFSFREQQTTVDKTNSAIRDYILSLGELNGIQGANALISQSLTGQISNLQDKLAAMFNEIGTANSGVLYSALDITSSLIDNYELVGKILVGLVATYGAYRVALIVATTAEKGHSITTLAMRGYIIAANAAQKALNATMLLNPYVAVTVAVVGLGAAMWALHDNTTAAERSQAALNDRLEEQKTVAENERSEIEKNISTIKDEISTRTEKQLALNKLQTLYPSIFAGLDTEKIKNMNLVEVLKLVNEELEKKNNLSDKKDLGSINDVLATARLGTDYLDMSKAKEVLGDDKTSIWDTKASLKKKLEAERDAILQKQRNEADAKKQAAFEALSSAQKVEALKRENVELEKQAKLLESGGAIGEIPAKELRKKILSNKSDIEKYSSPEAKKPETEIERKEREKNEKDAAKAYKKALEDFEKDKLDAQNDAYKADLDAKRAQITDKKELNRLEYEDELKSIQEKENLFKESAKKAGIKNPDLSSFATMRTSAKTVYDTSNQAVDNEQLKKDNDAIFQEAIKEYEQLKELKAKYTDEITQIDKEYNADIEKLQGDKYVKERAAAKAERDAKVSAVTEGLISESEAYKLATDDKLQASKETTEKLIADIKARIEAELAAGKLSSETAKKMLAEINQAQATVKGDKNKNNPFAQLGDAIKGNSSAQKALKAGQLDPATTTEQLAGLESAAASATAGMAGAAGAALMGVQDILGSVVDGMDRLGMLTEEEKKDAENVIGMVGGAANIAMGIATGNPMQIIQGSIDLIVNAFELFDKKGKDIAKKQKALVKDVDNLKAAYERLERAVSKAFSTDSARLQQQEIENIQAQIKANNEWIELENQKKKKKRDQEAIAAKQKENEDLQNSIQDKKDAIVESLTGTSIMSAIDQFANAYADAFTSGEDAALKSSDAVRSIFKSALIEKLKSDLQPGILQLMTMISSAMSDGIITADEKAAIELKKKEQDAIAERNQQAFEDLGLTDAANKKGALSGSIQNVSEETASIISGQMNAMRINQIESINIMRNQLLALNQIATNTAYNRFLENIDRTLTKLSADNLRASGL